MISLEASINTVVVVLILGHDSRSIVKGSALLCFTSETFGHSVYETSVIYIQLVEATNRALMRLEALNGFI